MIRRYFVAFSTLFNEIKVPRYADDGTLRELIRVPIALGPKDKTLARVFAEPGANSRPQAITLPRMSFVMGPMSYDGARHQTTTESIVVQLDDEYTRVYTPAPWDFPFDLFIYSKTQEDGMKIVEQILPMFQPDVVLRIELVPEIPALNIPVIISGSVTCEDDYDGSLPDRRSVVWRIPFTLKGLLFGPKHDSGIIKFVDVPLYVPIANGEATAQQLVDGATRFNTGAIDRVTVQPGLTANGEPTTNVEASVDFTLVQLDDDWAYAVKIYGNLDSREGTGGADEPIED